jgi:uncharacterized protein
MDPTKTLLAPVLTSIGFVIIVEIAASNLFLSPLNATGLARIIQIFVMIGAFHFSSSGVAALGLSTRRIKHGIVRGIVWSIAFGLISGLLGIALMLYGINPIKLIRMSLPDSTEKMVAFYMVGGIIAPIAEEIFFRGVIYGYLRDRLATRHLKLGIIKAVAISTLLFVFAHSGGSGVALPQLVGGILFCLSYEKEKSLLTPIIIHGSGNIAIFTLSLIFH